MKIIIVVVVFVALCVSSCISQIASIGDYTKNWMGKTLEEKRKPTLRPESYAILDGNVTKLKSNAKKLTVEGHTDSIGTDAYNQKLSERRAQTVYNYFTSKGIEAARLTAVGKGETSPVADNKTEEGRFKNRRVELHVH